MKLDAEDYQRTFEHAMEIWFEPEIRRRQEQGVAPKPFQLRKAQVIIYPDERPNEIRLNEEVQAVGQVKLKDGVIKKPGDPIYLDEFEDAPSIELPETADPNCGHFTLLLIGDRWYGSFDFRYNKGKARELLSAAEDFYEISSTALSAGKMRPAIDNLFSAAELAPKAYVISMPLPGDSDSKSHGHVHTRFNMFSQHGNIDSEHRKVFNALASARAGARYLQGAVAGRELVMKWQTEIAGLIAILVHA